MEKLERTTQGKEYKGERGEKYTPRKSKRRTGKGHWGKSEHDYENERDGKKEENPNGRDAQGRADGGERQGQKEREEATSAKKCETQKGGVGAEVN